MREQRPEHVGEADAPRLTAAELDGVLGLLEEVSVATTPRELHEALLRAMCSPRVFGARHALILEGDDRSDVLFVVAATSEALRGEALARSERLERVLGGQIVALKDGASTESEWSELLLGVAPALHAVLHIPLRSTTMIVAFHDEVGQFTREHVVAAGYFIPVVSRQAQQMVEHQVQLQRLRAESERRVMREQFLLIKHAARSLGAGVAVLDTQGKLRLASDALMELIEAWGSDEAWWLVARRVLSETPITGSEAVGGQDEPQATRHIAKRKVDMDDPRGARRVFELTFTGTPHRFEDGELGHVLLVADVTRWVRVEDELIFARDESERANIAKSRFLANMSHELRTPLNAIIGYSELLQEEVPRGQDETLREDLGKIHLSARQLLSLINDVLDLSKIEAGKFEISRERFSLDALLDELEYTIHPMIKGSKNRFVRAQRDLPADLQTDRDKLRQILLNLLSNAAKFTEGGMISLSASNELLHGERRVVFQVTDTGIGIAADKLNKIFTPFEQVDPTATRRYGGTGLGLAISHRLALMIGAKIEVESEPGRGSTFRVKLPVERDV